MRTLLVREYLPQLDGLRTLAVLAVLAMHISSGMVPAGFLGVDLFFVLSGFLITALLAAEWDRFGSISFRLFFLRRFLRLYPVVVAAVALVGVFWKAFPPSEVPFGHLAAASLFYYANFIPISTPLSHAWSLSIEEQFYIVWPVVLARSLRLGRWQLSVPAVLIGLAVSVRIWMLLHNYSPQSIFRFPLARMDALAAGAGAALLVRKYGARDLAGRFGLQLQICQVLALIGMAVLCLFAKLGVMESWGFTGVALLFGALISAAVLQGPLSSWPNKILSASPMVYIGRRSYGIYLYHFPIFLLTERFRAHGSAGNFLCVSGLRLGLTALGAIASYRWLERPILRLKGRFAREYSSTATVEMITASS